MVGIDLFHPGADLENPAPSIGLPKNADPGAARPSFVMGRNQRAAQVFTGLVVAKDAKTDHTEDRMPHINRNRL